MPTALARPRHSGKAQISTFDLRELRDGLGTAFPFTLWVGGSRSGAGERPRAPPADGDVGKVSISPIDSTAYGGLFTTPSMRAVFSDEARLQRMLDVEAALARAEAKLGLIPAEAAAEITAKADVARFDLQAIGQGTELVGYPIVPLVKALGQACAGDAGRYVHWGATTQDIIDTALVLQLRDGLALIGQELHGIETALAGLARRYRDTPMAGRTHLQHALPITFGFKCALWLAPLQRHRARLARLREEIAVVQFGGAVGTL
ncbi:MAG: lyase family protein, partial [Geminicoccaceae bacterium]